MWANQESTWGVYQSVQSSVGDGPPSPHAIRQQSPETGIKQETYDKVAKAITTIPDGFKPLKQIEKLLKDRKEAFFETKLLGWAEAELLAYGSLLTEGILVRMSGQDVKRGTFSHRHAVLRNEENDKAYNRLSRIDGAKG